MLIKSGLNITLIIIKKKSENDNFRKYLFHCILD